MKSPRLISALIVATTAGLLFGSTSSLADAPPGRYTIDEVEDTVLDTKTGLTWQRTAAPKPFTASPCPVNWRRPTLNELVTLVDRTRVDPAIDIVAFPDTAKVPFWSDSRTGNGGAFAWTVDFATGATLPLSINETHYLRCVR